MKIADLFVDLDIKGAVKVKDALAGTQAGLQKTAEMSLAAKAGILGAILGLEELTRNAVGTAVDMKNFAGATGLSTQELQKWMYLAKMNDVAGEELTSTIKGLQNAQAAMALGKGVPEGALWFGLDPSKNPLEMFGQIQQKLRQVGNDQKQIGIARSMAATLGISDNMFAMLRAGNLGLQNFRRELLLTSREQQTLLKLDRTWQQFWWDLKMGSEKLVADDLAGPITGAVKILSDAVQGFGDLVKDFKKLAHEMEWDTKGLSEGWKLLGVGLAVALAPLAPYTAALTALALVLQDVHKYQSGQESVIGTGLASPGAQTFKNEGVWEGLKRFGGLGSHADEDFRRSAGLPEGTDTRTNWEQMSDWFAGVMARSQPVPIGSAAGQGIVNNVNISIGPGVRDRDVPTRTAQEVVRALSQLPKGGQ